MYEAFFNLKEKPFKTSPDPRFFYLTAQHTEALTNCQYMIQERVGPVYVHGDVGTGKTTIARRLMQQLQEDPKYIVAMVIEPNIKSANAFLRLVMKEFGVKTEKKYEDSLENFGNFLNDKDETGFIPVLLVDEAHLLRPDMLETVRFLLNFETDSHKRLQIILLGQNELATNIESKKELKSRMYRNALSSLTRDDTEKMIQFRFQIAGGGTHPFTPEAIDAIFRCSLGLPRLVCQLCDMSLLRAYTLQQKKIGADIIKMTSTQLRIDEEEKAMTEKEQKTNNKAKHGTKLNQQNL
jgi:general secretion pathway protein A